MPPSFTWQALSSGQGWPATAEQERKFADDLRRASWSAACPTRAATTCVMNALRCGVTFAQLLEELPGACPNEMWAGYRLLAKQLRKAAKAWQHIADNPSTLTLTAHSGTAQLLVPVPVYRVTAAVFNVNDPAAVRAATRTVVARIDAVTASAHTTETVLSRFPPGDRIGIQLGRRLHDIGAPGLWAEPYFLPRRVGELAPTRVGDLRGDPR